MELNSKGKGCLTIFLLFLVLGTVLNLYDNITFDRSELNGEWIYSTTSYNPFSLGGVIQKGNYPVNYLLSIENGSTYKVYHGSPGFEKLQSEGQIEKHTWDGIIFNNFSPENKNYKNYRVTGVHKENDIIQSFCLASDPKNIKCDLNFSRR
jgi:hypothetical protein